MTENIICGEGRETERNKVEWWKTEMILRGQRKQNKIEKMMKAEALIQTPIGKESIAKGKV